MNEGYLGFAGDQTSKAVDARMVAVFHYNRKMRNIIDDLPDMTLEYTADRLNKDGYRTFKNKKFTVNAVSRIKNWNYHKELYKLICYFEIQDCTYLQMKRVLKLDKEEIEKAVRHPEYFRAEKEHYERMTTFMEKIMNKRYGKIT